MNKDEQPKNKFFNRDPELPLLILTEFCAEKFKFKSFLLNGVGQLIMRKNIKAVFYNSIIIY